MSTALALNNIDLWNNENKLSEIRRMVSPSAPLTDLEFSFLVELGKATQLNPFMKEIWVVKYRRRNRDTGKYEDQPAQIFIGRDGYRKAAQRQRDYEYHQVNAVYSKDEFKIVNNEIHHNYGFANRGELLGAYCIVKRKGSSKYTYVMVTMEEYNLKQGLWKDKPETMIKKVAEAQAVRQAFQEVLAGTYSDAELPQEEEPGFKIVSGNSQTEKLNNLLNDNVVDAETVPSKPAFVEGSHDVMANEEQIKEINYLIDQKQLSEERIKKAYSLYKITELTQLTDAQARRFIFQLGKVYQWSKKRTSI
jgi:phage recombination protein Bet